MPTTKDQDLIELQKLMDILINLDDETRVRLVKTVVILLDIDLS